MSWLDYPANKPEIKVKNFAVEPFDIGPHQPAKQKTTIGFVPFQNSRDNIFYGRGQQGHMSDDEGDYRSSYRDDSVNLSYRQRANLDHAENPARSLVSSMRLINHDFIKNKEGIDLPVQLENDPGSICYLESDNEFLPDFEGGDSVLNTVFNPDQEEKQQADAVLIEKIKRLCVDGKVRRWEQLGEPLRVEFFKVLRPTRRPSAQLSPIQMQERIEMMNLTRERSRQHSEMIEAGEIGPSQARPIRSLLLAAANPPLPVPAEFDLFSNVSPVKEPDASLQPLPFPAPAADAPACRCKKTNCLKLYCECFLKGGICGLHCKCVDCMNTPAHQQIREMLLEDHYNKGTIAFNPLKPPAELPLEQPPKRERSCTCGKTGCNKKYCECFRNNSKCSPACKCRGCKNGNEGRSDEELAKLGAKKVIKKRRSNFLNSLIEKMKQVSKNKNAQG